MMFNFNSTDKKVAIKSKNFVLKKNHYFKLSLT